jgi:hypothetical protein
MRGRLLIGFRYFRQDFVKAATGDRENDCARFMFGPTRARLRRSRYISSLMDPSVGSWIGLILYYCGWQYLPLYG